MKNVLIIGNGVVGNANIKLLEKEFKVFAYDTDKNKSDFNFWNKGVFAKDYAMVVVTVPTPTTDGEQDLTILRKTLHNLYAFKRTLNGVPIVIRSTVLPGTCESSANLYPELNIVHMPEFITAENAYGDMLDTDRIIISGPEVARKKVLSFFMACLPQITTEFQYDEYAVSEMAKYANNYFLACKVALSNELYDMCAKSGINHNFIRRFISADSRIGPSHTYISSERGFGGMCFPKDLKALSSINPEASILKTVLEYNDKVRKNPE